MAESVPAGSDVSAGTYECTNCGNRIDVDSTATSGHALPATTPNGAITGGDSVHDPHPNRAS